MEHNFLVGPLEKNPFSMGCLKSCPLFPDESFRTEKQVSFTIFSRFNQLSDHSASIRSHMEWEIANTCSLKCNARFLSGFSVRNFGLIRLSIVPGNFSSLNFFALQ
jgi:hypothetical protein